MARKPKPWFRKSRKIWCVTIDGRQHNLGPDKKEAEKEFHRLMSEPKQTIRSDSLVTIFDLFLDWTQKNRAGGTYEWHLARLTEFGNTVKTRRVLRLQDLAE